MFDKFLLNSRKDCRLAVKWSVSIPALVRVPLFSDNGSGYVVSYAEKSRKYILSKFDPETGDITWNVHLHNGGYGAQAIGKRIVALPTSFTNLTGVDEESGEILWVYETSSRIRSPVSFDGTCFVFSSGAKIIRLDEEGQKITAFGLDDHFFFGLVREINGTILSLCSFTNKNGCSEVALVCFAQDGTLQWKRSFGAGRIISSDTAGSGYCQDRIYVAVNTGIYCLNYEDGALIWEQETKASLGRQMPTCSDSRIFIPSMDGQVFCCNACTGDIQWIFHGESTTSSPVSILGDLACVSMDGQIHLIDIETGRPFDQIPTGHSPYSAITFWKNRAFIGGGDPPYHGRLYAFDFVNRKEVYRYATFVNVVNTEQKDGKFHLQLEIANCDRKIRSVLLDSSAISETITNGAMAMIKPVSRYNDRFVFEVPARPTIVNGLYCVDIYLTLADGGKIFRTGLVSIQSARQRPKRLVLSGINPVFQTGNLNSGSAVAHMIHDYYQQPAVDQDQFRSIVEYIRERASYDPFNIWRLIFRRAISSGVQKIEDLPEYKLQE